MSKMLFSAAAAAALGLLVYTPAPAHASWLSEAVHRFLDQDGQGNSYYYNPGYSYPPPVQSYNYQGYPGYYSGNQSYYPPTYGSQPSYPPSSGYYGAPYYQPYPPPSSTPGYYGQWNYSAPERRWDNHDWDRWHGDHGWEHQQDRDWYDRDQR